MKSKRFLLSSSIALLILASLSVAQGQPASTKSDPREPRAKDGKKLLTATDLLRVNGVSAPRISPDGARVVYTVSEVKMEKDKEWKSTTHVWVVPTGGGKARQFTRGDKNARSEEHT